MARRHEALEFAQLQTPTHPFSQGTVSISEEGGEVNCTDAATGKMEFSSDRFFFSPLYDCAPADRLKLIFYFGLTLLGFLV